MTTAAFMLIVQMAIGSQLVQHSFGPLDEQTCDYFADKIARIPDTKLAQVWAACFPQSK